MLENGRGLIKALEMWAKKVTVGYRDVNVRDLSTSFRDGMAFCAIIHHYRPDLIDFESLSIGNIFENNSVAFSVAEKQLGVPALLDAEDMVKYSRPDRLSIITYLSQLRNCFENHNKVNLKKPELKRIQTSTQGPPTKISVIQPTILATVRHEVCQLCKHRVFILERLIVDGKLYHTTCFRCHKCDCLLNPGAYVESDTPGFYECSVCLTDETIESPKLPIKTTERFSDHRTSKLEISTSKQVSESPNLSVKARDLLAVRETDKQEISSSTLVAGNPKLFTRLPEFHSIPQKQFTSKEAVSFAKTNLSSETQTSPIIEHSLRNLSMQKESPEMKQKLMNGSEISISVKDKINVFEKNQSRENSPLSTPTSGNKHLPIDTNEQSASFQLDESTEKPNSSSEKSHSFSVNITPIRTLRAFEKPSAGKINGNKKSEDSSNKISEQSFINSKALTKSLSKELKPDGSIFHEFTKDKNSYKINKYLFKNTSEPDVPRDIFKSSLQPLKLNFQSSIRKEATNSLELSDSEKTVFIPQIKSNYSKTLPHSSINRKMSLREDNINVSHSEYNLKSDAKSININKNRRSSLESASECDGNKLEDASYKLGSKSFIRAFSVQEIAASNASVKSSLKNYTPIYKSILSTSGLSKASSLRNSSNLTYTSVSVKSVSEASLKSEDLFCIQTNDELHSPSFSESSLNANEKKLDLNNSFAKITQNVETSASCKDDIAELQEKEYPDDLNPFGEEDNGDKEEEYPDDLNPFGDEGEINNSKVSIDDYDESKNPFASDEDDDETPKYTSISPKPLLFENKSPSYQDSISSSTFSSPSSSLKGTLKKRQAPKPPAISEIFSKDFNDSGLDSSFNSLKSSPASVKRNFQTSSPKIRKNKPAPPPPPTVANQDPAANVKMTKETDNVKLRSSVQSSDEKPRQALKKKKRPAPSVPIPIRKDMKKIPLKQILQEMKDIEEKQREYERQGREIELLIRDRDKDEEASIEEEEYIMQLFELVNQKNALFRRQAELMYIKRSQRLEEQQCQIEREIRILMQKSESERTDEDKRKEEELTLELIDIVDQRNSIIDSIEMDRRRELEEDHSVQESIEVKNGDLPIAAEIREKSNSNMKKKEKKKDKKKDKKKPNKEEQESGKGTLKRKKLFSRTS